MRFRFALLLSLVGAAAFAETPLLGPSWDFGRGALRVSSNGRFLEHANGQPFFYLGDTAWELFHRLNRSEAERYLENRRQKGFTVIQAVALAELDGLNTPNAHGDRPLLNNNPATPWTTTGNNPANATEYDYWDHVDYIVDTARAKGLYVGLLPTWGDKVRVSWGVGPIVFNATNARQYGQFLGARYRSRPNILWILGGDRNADGQEAVWRAMAEGLAEGGSTHLRTYHPQGGSTSSTWFHHDSWLAFNMLQSGHGGFDLPNYNNVANDYNRSPVKPCMDSEPRYENHPVNWNPSQGWFNDFDVRQAAYWALFAGAHGHTYGCHDIWQMYAPGRSRVSSARTYWYDALDFPGAWDMLHVRNLMLSRPFTSRVPDQGLIAAGQVGGAGHLRATRGDGYAFVYAPTGVTFTVNLGRFSGGTARGWWFDPRSGEATSLGTFANSGTRSFDPPGNPARGNDWVLVLDDAARNFAAPGGGAVAPPPPPPAGDFVKGINLGGGALTIDGNPWQSYSSALGSGFSVSISPNLASTNVSPNPATTSDVRTMLNSAIWSPNSFSFAQNVPNGAYDVFLWVMENHQSNARAFDIKVEGLVAAAAVGTMSLGSWAKIGPLKATVNDGALSIELVRRFGDPHVMGLAIFRTSTPPPPPAFVKGVNLGGGAVTIDGQAWQSYSAALGSGFSVSPAPRIATTSVSPNPSATGDVGSMLNSAIWNTGNFSFSQTLANGAYDVYLWVMENHQSNYRAFDVKVEGLVAAAAVGTLSYGSWMKMGPFPVTVSDGALSVELVRRFGDPHVMGVAIYRR